MNNTEYELLTKEDLAAMLEAAEEYNERLLKEIKKLDYRIVELEVEVEWHEDHFSC